MYIHIHTRVYIYGNKVNIWAYMFYNIGIYIYICTYTHIYIYNIYI